ncbi:unnamed protein product [Rotaria magnacalcarata]|uniref:DAGKc domain-containing protein n=3 Tax=Rotaria magnacalcarata TaxID=392030 RepID=A0A815I4B8_9BILA|nr:unnamed protein product [Rotaria magnacalcarata]CAF2121760.1 unnamed protein product [Rotaria magnacalcarata]
MFRTIRNNWKKSIFAFCALSYGANWSYDRYQANQIRQFYCQQASIMGSQTLSPMTHANRVAVLLNGQANNGKAKSIYDKTIFPLLHLIGLDVRVYRIDTITDPNGLNELLTTKIEPEKLSALMIVGGDGTLSELTPHLLQSSVLQNLPICIIPIGEHLSFARSLFPTTNKKKLHDDITLLCESVLALFNGKVVRKPLLKITMSNTSEKPTYASTFELGHYTRLEQLQKRLWYFSYLKYPVSSIYLYIANSIKSILSSEQPSLVYSNPCSGCLRCQPSLMDQYRLSQEKPKSTFFSRIYQSNRTNPKPVVPELTEPVENPNCGIEYCMNFDKEPLQLWAKLTNDDRSFEIDLSNKFERFNYDKVKYPKESFNVQHIRFYPNPNLISLHMLINHEKLDKKKENEETDLGEYRIELSEKTLKFIEISNDLLLAKKSTLKPIFNKLEEDGLEKKAIFLFNRRQQHN